MENLVGIIDRFLKSNTPDCIPSLCTRGDIEAIEKKLRFSLPQILADCFTQLGNGGYGPGYGIIGIGLGGHQSDHGDLYALRESLKSGLAGSVEWPERLLPFCEWGCNIYSCVECSESAPIWLYRDNHIRQQPFSIAEFFRDWMCGDVEKYVDWGTVRKEKFLRNPATGEEELVVYRVLE